ncbi:Translation protein SH3-like domain superfamily [Arabidopsis thaliana x Arabidopsis arenosa]|uniref:Translation protein SH3-like domain superfamily n=1 Tax=Arabidopsis thaliana x Arabidopsis arenosa TaxID=1240361 RepID=A0A8T1XE38_9BRAS|nr:Translation protein SH3-like domain superfamily [Arabidopsis thaliana x Arabidopsis arenosa]
MKIGIRKSVEIGIVSVGPSLDTKLGVIPGSSRFTVVELNISQRIMPLECTLEKWRTNLSDMWHNLLSQVDAGLKAGNAYHVKRNSWPKVRGVAMNPVEHPHGGVNHQHIGQASMVRRDASPRRTGGLRGQDAASAGKAD